MPAWTGVAAKLLVIIGMEAISWSDVTFSAGLDVVHMFSRSLIRHTLTRSRFLDPDPPGTRLFATDTVDVPPLTDQSALHTLRQLLAVSWVPLDHSAHKAVNAAVAATR